MSIEGKHAYRFGYLKSEAWSNVRLEALAREKGKCQICDEESISNDAHHIWYPGNIYETEERHLVILCRACHDFIHAMRPDCKTSDEEAGRMDWETFFNAVLVWRIKKAFLFDGKSEFNLDCVMSKIPPKQLRQQYEKTVKELKSTTDTLRHYQVTYGLEITHPSKEKSVEQQIDETMKVIKSWSKSFRESVSTVKVSLVESDFQI